MIEVHIGIQGRLWETQWWHTPPTVGDFLELEGSPRLRVVSRCWNAHNVVVVDTDPVR